MHDSFVLTLKRELRCDPSFFHHLALLDMFLARRFATRSLRPVVEARPAASRSVLVSRAATSLISSAPRTSSATTTLSKALRYARSFTTSPQSWKTSDNTASPPHAEKHPIASLRNISIIAHIDAGKTTLTERLLHLTNALSPSSSSASSALPGDVDSGSTVTDFLEQERQRGITIQSAAVGPVWWPTPNSSSTVGITLVDTPGHIDFGIEVERALRVVDGAVVVLDGVEGVEAQTENVWSQAARYDVKASILFINKLDRMGSSVAQSIRSVIRSGMHKRPLLLQLPVPVEAANEPGLAGLVDLIEMQVLTFSGKAGEIVKKTPLEQGHEIYAEAKQARHALVESLASLDEELLEELFSLPTTSNEEPHSKVTSASLRAAIRRQTLTGSILPVLCGSAAKNIGVQPLLDAIADYLPSPVDKPDVIGNVASSTEDLKSKEVKLSLNDKRTTALAFKVVHDKRRGPTTFVRIYSGTLQRSTVLFNTTTGARERLSRVFFPFADQYTETATLRAGQIGVILGLRDTRTGDTLVDISSTSSAKSDLSPAEVKSLRLKRVHIPPPVFSLSLEPASKSDVDAVSDALNLLIRTDPSLRLDEAGANAAGAGQTVLSGMGELHLEIAKDRLANEFGVNARMGNVRVSYRETLGEEIGLVVADEVVERDLAGKKIKVGAKMSVRALSQEELDSKAGTSEAMMFGGNIVSIDLSSPEQIAHTKAEDDGDIQAYLTDTPASPRKKDTATDTLANLPTGIDLTTLETQFRSGLVAALSRGPLTSNPLMGLSIRIFNIQLFGDLSSSAAISYLLSSLLRTVLRTVPTTNPDTGLPSGPAVAKTVLMEPMMTTRITVPDAALGKVISDITAEQDGEVVDVVHQTQRDVSEEDEGEVWIPSKSNRFEMQSSAASSGSGKGGGEGGAGGKAEIHAVVPLANLVRYSSKLRALTAGNAQFSMQLQGFAKVSQSRQNEILQELGR